MIKKTLLGFIIASSLVLTGCSAAENTDNTPTPGITDGSSTDGTTVDPGASTIDKLAQLPTAEFLDTAPTEVDDALVAELLAIVTASVEKAESGLVEKAYSVVSGENFNLYYKNPAKKEAGVSALIDDKGAPVEGLTAFLQDTFSFSLYAISIPLESPEVLTGISKDADGGYSLAVLYAQAEGEGIKVVYYITVKDGLVSGILSGDNFSAESVVLKTLVEYTTNAEYDALYDSAVSQGQLPTEETPEESVVEETEESTN